MEKRLIIVGGANGVGKTTFAYQYRDDFDIPYLGADKIAEELQNNDEINIDIKAGRIFYKKLEKFLYSANSVIIESTLSGKVLADHIRNFKANGYSIHIIYVFLSDISQCKYRVALRVKKGGHNVPDLEIERRFYRSLNNFRNIYSTLADKYQMFYNGFERPVEVLVKEKQNEIILDDELYSIFQELSK